MSNPAHGRAVRAGRRISHLVILLSLPLIISHAIGECLPMGSERCVAARATWLPILITLLAGTALLSIGLGWVTQRLMDRWLRRHDADDHRA